MNRQTYHAKNNEVPQEWWVVDASGEVLGRLATRLATMLMGKHKPQYTPHHDVGDFIVIINAERIVLTGEKASQKFHETFSGHPSGRKVYSYKWMIEHRPEKLIELAVRRMMPKTKLGVAQIKKLKVYAGPTHPHAAQCPKDLKVA